jgi:group I intron endonuclease
MKDKKCGIYKITNTANLKMLIGQSTNIFQRWIGHRKYARKNKHWNYRFQADWNAYPEGNFRFDIILECPPEKLNEEEIRLIREYHSQDKNVGYNIQSGGDCHQQSEETRRKIGLSKVGAKNPNYGKHIPEEIKKRQVAGRAWYRHSEETRKHMSDVSIGRKFTEEWKRHISEGRTGLKLSEEHRRRLSEVRQGQGKGKHPSEETKRKISEALIRRSQQPHVVQVWSSDDKRRLMPRDKNGCYIKQIPPLVSCVP